MKNLYTFINIFLTALVAVVMFQTIPSLISSSDWIMFGTGVGLVLLGLAFVIARGVEIYKDLINVRKEEK